MNDNKAFLHMRKGMRKMWESDELINAIVKTDDGLQFRVHWELLVALSPYIERMVEALPNSPGDTPLLQITVSNVTGVTMSSIINCAYSGKLSISPRKVEGLVRAANLLEIPSIVNMCIKYLSNHINEDTCIAIYNFARHFECKQLFEKAVKFLLANFEKIYPTSFDFLILPFEDLASLIASDELNISSEEKVFWAIIRWTEHDTEARRQHLPALLGCMRFGFCTMAFYEESVVTNPLIAESQECQSVLYQASMLFVEMYSNPSEARPIDIHHPLIRPRIPNELIFAIGGWSNGSATHVIETYDIRGGRWFLCSYSDNMPRAYHGLVALGSVIYMIGGFDGNQCFNTVRCFDAENHLWYERACMYVARCYISVAAVGDIIYALGGYDGHTRVNSGECYYRDTNQWHIIANMHQVRSDASAAAVDGKIYIAGGFNGQQVLSSAEFYDPETNVWTMISDMASPRSGVNLIAYNDTIYVIGGFNGTNRLSTAERYDVRLRQWLAVAQMNTPRSNFATATIEGHLYVIGGFNGITTVSSVERYSSLTDSWQPVAEMNVNRSALAACVTRGLANNQEYSFLGNSPN